jgi:hypothetical protein
MVEVPVSRFDDLFVRGKQLTKLIDVKTHT